MFNIIVHNDETISNINRCKRNIELYRRLIKTGKADMQDIKTQESLIRYYQSLIIND